MKKFALTVLAVCGLSLLLMGSSCEGHGDAPMGDTNHAPANVVEFPDGFRNVAYKCDGRNMVYSASRGSSSDAVAGSVYVVANDPRCGGAK